MWRFELRVYYHKEGRYLKRRDEIFNIKIAKICGSEDLFREIFIEGFAFTFQRIDDYNFRLLLNAIVSLESIKLLYDVIILLL